MKILFVGSPSNFNLPLAEAIRRMGIDIRFENEQTTYFFGGLFKENRLLWRISQHYWRLKHFNRRLFNNRLISICRSWKPDIFLTTRGYYQQEDTIRTIRKLGVKTVNWCAENVHNSQWTDWFFRMINWYDSVFSYDSGIVERVKHDNPKINIKYLPLASDPGVARDEITEEDRRRFECDVCFLGGIFGERRQLLQSIVDAGINIKIFSRSDAKGTPLEKYWCGPLTDREIGKLYRVAKICLNQHLAPLGDGADLRTFEIPAAGGFQLSDMIKDLPDVYTPDLEVVIYNPSNVVEKIRYYLSHPEERIAIAKAGRIRTERDNSLVVRFRQLLAQL